MKLYLIGHEYQYAAEQMLLTLFPEERPEYPDTPAGAGEAAVTLSLFPGKTWVTATARLCFGGKRSRAAARVKTQLLSGKVETDRALTRIIKLAFYRAAVEALGKAPAWGALTGVRPVKLAVRAMRQGASPARARAMLERTYMVAPDRSGLLMDCAGASLAAQRALAPRDLSFYVGIPFCPSRCAYCSFVSADVGRNLSLVEPYLEALFREIEAVGARLSRAGRTVKTVYIGGGTPTVLTAGQLEKLMRRIEGCIDLSNCIEYTVEAGRPDTITAEKLEAIRAGGATRVSVNPQSMQPHVLSAMGRAHGVDAFYRAFAAARAAGIGAINTDLIAGLPQDTPEGFRGSLDAVLALAPENVTVHTLALKKGSRLMLEKENLPGAGAVGAMLDYAWGALRAHGYRPYYLYRQKFMSGSFENVGWSRPGLEGVYNICMMEELHTVVSAGAGGMTKLVDPAAGSIARLANPKFPKEYGDHIEKTIKEKAAMPLT